MDATDHDYISWFTKRLNIPAIAVGAHDTTLRVWFWQPGDTVWLLHIEKYGTTGFGHVLGFGNSVPRPNFSLAITRCSATDAPFHGWERLFDTLRFDDIASIPDGKPNDQLSFGYCCTSGGRIFLEYQQDSQYRFYSYFEPGYYQFVDSNAGKLHHFLTFLQTEFSLRVYQDMTSNAATPIRAGNTLSHTEYQHLRRHGFVDSGERVVELYGDFTSYTAILTDRRIGDYFPRWINLGDSVYEYVRFPAVKVNLNFSTWGTDTVRVTRKDGSNFDLRLGEDRRQLIIFFDSTDAVLRRFRHWHPNRW